MSSPLASEDEVTESVPERQSSLTPIDSDHWLLVQRAWAIQESRMASRPLHDISSDPEDSDESLSEPDSPSWPSAYVGVDDSTGPWRADVEDEVPESLPDRPRSPIVIHMPSDEEPWSCDEPDWQEGDEDESSDGTPARPPPERQRVSPSILYPWLYTTSLQRAAPRQPRRVQPLFDPFESEDQAQPPRGRKRAASSPLPARPPPVSPSTMALSPIWQSLPEELVQRVLHELVTIHLWEIDSDPFYPWETLRQLNHQQRRRIDALYRQLLLPIFRLARWVEFCPTSMRREIEQNLSWRTMDRFLLVWGWDTDEAYDFTNDTITLPLWDMECKHLHESDDGDDEDEDGEDDDDIFDTSEGWNKYVNSFPPGGLYVKPEPNYNFHLRLSSRDPDQDWFMGLDLKIPASHVPDVQDNSDDDSIKVSWSQLIRVLMRAWKKEKIKDEQKCEGIWAHQWYISLKRLRKLDVV